MDDVKQIIRDKNILDVIGEFVTLEKNGSEYYGKCPFHEDYTASLQVNEKKQIFKCFACGPGGDALDFLTEYGFSLSDGINKLKGQSVENNSLPEKRESIEKLKKESSWIVNRNPTHAPKSFEHYKFGTPSKVWQYKNESGVVISYVCRFDFEDGKKTVLPFSFASKDGVSKWIYIGLDTPRPLYALDLIVKYPNSPIIVVEGEKTADAVQEQLHPEKGIATCWIGGSKSIKNSDFSVLTDRTVILWPDNDTEQKDNEGNIKSWYEQPGNDAMLKINEIINSKAKKIKWVKVPNDKTQFPHKWDAADRDWNSENEELLLFIRENLKNVPKFVVEKKTKEQKPKTQKKVEEPHPSKPKNEVFSHHGMEYFRFLGYSKDENMKPVYFFYSFGAKMVFRYSASGFNKSSIKTLAPMNFWEMEFPAKSSKVDIDMIETFLIETSHKFGPYKSNLMRGRGAWIDNNKLIIHTGEKIIRGKEKFPIIDFQSKYVYEIGESLGFGSGKALKTQDLKELMPLIKQLKWEREINAYLLAGWCVIAPFCGVLNWRPHIWLTGPAGSGKSWTLEHIVKRLCGDSQISVQGKTTEAGVRGLLQSDARPILFDESDVDSNSDKERIQSVLALARSSSYSDGGLIGKGTQSGTSRTYQIRSCFAFSSIGVHMNQQSDKSRISVLGLLSFKNFMKSHKSSMTFEEMSSKLSMLLSDEFVNGLHARTAHLMPIIIKNTKTFSDAAAEVIQNRRTGDQVGSMLAGVYSLTSSKEISFEDAVKWVESKDWTEEKSLELTKDEFQLFDTIMTSQLSIETERGHVNRSIAELLMIASNYASEPNITHETAHNVLKRHGIMFSNEEILISNNNPGLSRLIKETAWSRNHAKVLQRLPDAEKRSARRFSAGSAQRCVSIPIELIMDKKTIQSEIFDFQKFIEDDEDVPF